MTANVPTVSLKSGTAISAVPSHRADSTSAVPTVTVPTVPLLYPQSPCRQYLCCTYSHRADSTSAVPTVTVPTVPLLYPQSPCRQYLCCTHSHHADSGCEGGTATSAVPTVSLKTVTVTYTITMVNLSDGIPITYNIVTACLKDRSHDLSLSHGVP